jgi:glycosyltransferase involved in cell wall biosynthesis
VRVLTLHPGGETTPRLTVSVIVPVYNERHLVAASLRRLLELRHERIESVEVLVVDDRSTDGTTEILRRLASEDRRVTLFEHPSNRGKGAAVRTAIPHAKGDVTVVHDADLEYDPRDIPRLLEPFVTEGADAVFGSRFMASPYRRALMFRHSLMNRALTHVSNLFTDLDLTDVETCYKAVRTRLLQSIPLRSRDFQIEIELPAKLAKRRARIFEVPIRYVPRSYEEGKKIRASDGLKALGAMLRWSVLDDAYGDDEYGAQILLEIGRARRFNDWMAEALRPHLGNRVLEIGAGIGTLTSCFLPRERYVASDVNPHYLHYLRNYALGKPYLEVREIDVQRREHFTELAEAFDTVLLVNVLEHVADDAGALANVRSALAPGGRVVALVPAQPALYGTLDEALGHRRRYAPETLRAALERSGLELESVDDFNRFSVPGWWLNGKVMGRRSFSRLQIKGIEMLMPVLARFDRVLPWAGQSLVARARRR